MLPTMVIGRAIMSGVCTPQATSMAAMKAAIIAGEKSNFGFRLLRLYSPLTSITPAVNIKNVLGVFKRAA